MPTHNADITTTSFEEIAGLIEIQGANPFRVGPNTPGKAKFCHLKVSLH